MSALLTGCGKEKYEPGPTWNINSVFQTRVEFPDFTIGVPEWSSTGRFGSDYYLENTDAGGGKALLFVANGAGWADQYTPPTTEENSENPDGSLSSEDAGSTEDVPVSEDAMYALMATRLDALMFQLDELRYIKGTYSTVTEAKFRAYEGVAFQGSYTFAEDEEGTNSVVHQGTGACFNSEAGAVLVFALDMEDGQTVEQLTDTVEDICMSFRLQAQDGLVANPESDPATS